MRVPKSMNPLWGLKQNDWDVDDDAIYVPKSMNPLWGLKLRIRKGRSSKAIHVPKSMNPLWGLKRFEIWMCHNIS